MGHYYTILAVAIALILCCGCTGTSSSPAADESVATTQATPTETALPTTTIAATPTPEVQDYTFVQTIMYSNENGTSVITKNKLAKTAEIEMTLKVETPSGFNATTYHELVTGMTANLLQMAFFNETALNEFNAQVEAWNAQECTVEDDSPADQRETAPGENPLAGYTVQALTIHILEEGTEVPISDAVITGPDEADASITIL
jgi:ABC-type phosphate/phosphonate transport system substrate-binding protein